MFIVFISLIIHILVDSLLLSKAPTIKLYIFISECSQNDAVKVTLWNRTVVQLVVFLSVLNTL